MTTKANIAKQNSANILPHNLQQAILMLRGDLKQAVNRNIERFPEDFMFKLNTEEVNSLISNRGSQSVIPPEYNFGGHAPYAFTEQGVAMLSSVLRSATAITSTMPSVP